MENNALLNSEINCLMEDFGNSMSKGEFMNSEIPSKLIELLNKGILALKNVPLHSEEYEFNVDVLVCMIAYSANVGIRNIGNELALNMKLPGLKYGESLVDEYRCLLDKINSIEMPEKTKQALKNDFILFYNIGNTQNRTGSVDSTNSSGCYIATMVYGDYEHPKVLILRQFRDNVLERNLLGKQFVKVYYFLSPKVVKRLQNCDVVNGLIRFFLDSIIKLIHRGFM